MDKNVLGWILAGVVFVVAVIATAVGVYYFGGGDELPAPVAEVAVSEVAGDVKTVDAGHTDEEKAAEYDEFMMWLEEEAAMADEAEAVAAEEQEGATVYEEPVAVAEEEPESFGQGGGTGESMPRWQSIWADFNLTPEEEARLREGFGLAIGRFMAMSPEDQAAERARFENMRIRWEGMGDEEREETSQRLRDRAEDWRRSGSVELPELSLD
jgi:hypothetical protein